MGSVFYLRVVHRKRWGEPRQRAEQRRALGLDNTWILVREHQHVQQLCVPYQRVETLMVNFGKP